MVGLLLVAAGVACVVAGVMFELKALLITLGDICILAAIICFVLACCGITCIDPNQAVFLTFCTKYIGTMKQNGVFWTNPCFK